MKKNILFFIKVTVAIVLLLIYLMLLIVTFLGEENVKFTSFFRHSVMMPGLIPLLCWSFFLFIKKPMFDKKLFLIAVISLVIHYFLFAVSAHYDGFRYWFVQFIELMIFGFALKRLFTIIKFDSLRKGNP